MTAPTAAPPPAAAFDRRDGLRYGALGLPLAFVALPLYVTLPDHYARQFGVPLATLGALLLALRLLDAAVDPALGRLADALLRRGPGAALAAGAVAALALALGFVALFFPPVTGGAALLAWAAGALALTYGAYSLLTVTHQAWGAQLGGDEAQRARIFAWREGAGLAGVLLAASLPSLVGLGWTAAALALALLAGWLGWRRAPRPTAAPRTSGVTGWSALMQPLRRADFWRLLAVFMLNGTASAVPATLMLFFVQDRLQAPASSAALALLLYFGAAVLSLPLWLRAVPRLGLARTWLAGMVLAVLTFAGAAGLGAGDLGGYYAVCVLSGLALGTDLALPGALLAGQIDVHGERGRSDGAYFGWWALATKLNLALAAGVALPLLALLGYSPGARDPAALTALTVAYAVLPCALKLAAAAALHYALIRAHALAPGPLRLEIHP